MRVGILLAAGQSERFGRGNKLLADLDGRPLVAHAVETLLDADLDAVTAIVADRTGDVNAVLEPFDVQIKVNSEYERGQAWSVRRGIETATDQNADAVVFALGDMPCVDPETVHRLCEIHEETNTGIVVPTFHGNRGNPVLFDRQHFDALANATDDVGGRNLFETESVRRVPVSDPGVRIDIDTVTDLDALKKRR